MAKKNEIKWINCAKLLAILAVLTDHSEMILYDNASISMATYFSVTLFVFISGMMFYKSVTSHNSGYCKTVSRKLKRILPAYLLAVFIYQIAYIGVFDFSTYINYIINFNICGHFYYISVYIQLMLIGWVLVRAVNNVATKYSIPFEIMLGLVILFISSYTTNCSNVLYIYGGGGKLLGGTYLFIFYLGILAMKHNWLSKIGFIPRLIVAALSFLCTIAWWRFECQNKFALDSHLPFGEGINPPSITIAVMMILIVIFCFSFFTALQDIPQFTKAIDFLSTLGGHTLYIFLYHRLVLDRFLVPKVNIGNIWLKRVIYMLLMIAIPVIIEYILTEFKAFLVKQQSTEITKQ